MAAAAQGPEDEWRSIDGDMKDFVRWWCPIWAFQDLPRLDTGSYQGLETNDGCHYPNWVNHDLYNKVPFSGTGLAVGCAVGGARVPVIHGPEDRFYNGTSTEPAVEPGKFGSHGPEEEDFYGTTSTKLAVELGKKFGSHGSEHFYGTTSTELVAVEPGNFFGSQRLSIKKHAAAPTVQRMHQAKTLACPAPPATAFGSTVADPGGAAASETRIFLDSGASFHAVGDFRMLHGFQFYPRGTTVALPDGSCLCVVGVGTLQKDDRSACGNHVIRSYNIPNVRLVAGLQKNLISVGQLDVEHGLCCSFHSNKCEIMMADGTITGGAILEEDGMYVLRFLEVQEETLRV